MTTKTKDFAVRGSEEAIQKQMTRCKHWKGSFNRTTCGAGVEFDKIRAVDGSFFERLPCFNPALPCEKACYPTREEVMAREKQIDAMLDRVALIRTAILEDLDGKRGGSGVIPCPACKTGNVRYSRASLNGHVHAKCSTPNCASWME